MLLKLNIGAAIKKKIREILKRYYNIRVIH